MSQSITHATENPALRFSVIVNIYNGEEFLRETIDSVLAQSFTDFEVILWDDCSTDGSRDICASYCADERIQYFRLPKQIPLADARMQAVKKARGEWLAFLDQDDIWLPHKLAAQNQLIEGDTTGRLGLVYGRTIRFDRRGRRSVFDPWHGNRRLPEGDIFDELLRRPSFVALSSVAIHRDRLLEGSEMPSYVTYCPDYYFCVAICRRYLAACLQEACCLYRVHELSMSQVYRRQIHEEALQIIEDATRPSQQRILRNRRLVHQTWIGLEEIRTRRTFGRGVLRILRKGSLAYLTLRPFLLLGRLIRQASGR